MRSSVFTEAAEAIYIVPLFRIAAGQSRRELDPAGSGGTHQCRLQSDRHALAPRPCYPAG
jgi:hypothetical protein